MQNTNISHDIIENRTIYSIIINEDRTMKITATEFKENLGKYLDLVASEDIIITKNGKTIAVLTKPVNRAALWDSLVGCAKSPDGSDIDLGEIRSERLKLK